MINDNNLTDHILAYQLNHRKNTIFDLTDLSWHISWTYSINMIDRFVHPFVVVFCPLYRFSPDNFPLDYLIIMCYITCINLLCLDDRQFFKDDTLYMYFHCQISLSYL